METARASRTAVLVCQGRAVADGRAAVGRFADPVAVRLLEDDERREVALARAADDPADVRERLIVERLRAVAEGMVARTVAIDDAIADAGHRQVVILGAGLDTRPWRLAALRDAVTFAVDHPASQAEARERAADLTPLGRLEFVPVDLSTDDLGPALTRAGHDPAAPTTWVWEGVVPYLTAGDVRATVAALAERSAPGSVAVVQYQTRSWTATAGRRLSGLVMRLTRTPDPLAAEPWRSLWSPTAMARLLAEHGFAVVTDDDLLAIAGRLGSPAAHRRSLTNGRVAVARHR
ncbi:class I SAM-dependent methyltransferase [Petropleomorpha daqingensis]|uniref:S-adenosyl-L-methionine-dependent methyltransferase n=1 Tax=Petropleomorpha daqingensis TaxID=2026353 RepID=A0A853CIE9_9ACTN|nr:methyltransferase (TIGR00027 family) [Petropleomorpha daqingensis]